MVSLRRMAVAPEAGSAGQGPRFRTVDRVLGGYIVVTSIVAIIRLERFPDAAWVLAANFLTLVLILLLTGPGLGVVGRSLREIYPILLLPALYSAVDLLNGGGTISVHDPAVQGWEVAIFGGQPARDWWREHPSTFWSTVLHGAYFSYYLIVPLPIGWFAFTGKIKALRRTILLVTVTFVICYLAFLFYPVAGPYYQFPRPKGAFVDNPMARLVYDILGTGSAYGAAFPSSHVAATVTATAAAWMGSRKLGLALTIPTTLLIVGVVYTQMHYAVDAIAGLVVSGVVLIGWTILKRGMGKREWGVGNGE